MLKLDEFQVVWCRSGRDMCREEGASKLLPCVICGMMTKLGAVTVIHTCLCNILCEEYYYNFSWFKACTNENDIFYFSKYP